MKPFFLSALWLFSFHVFAQTPAIEMAWINKATSYQTITFKEAAEKRELLQTLVKEGGYPALPYDTITNDLVFTTVLLCPGMSKQIIFRRIKEWCAMSCGEFEGVIQYEDPETGKIILKGFINLPYEPTLAFSMYKKNRPGCEQSWVFTVKDDKCKISIQQLSFSLTEEGHTSGDAYVPDHEVKYYLSNIFPLMNLPSGERKRMLEFLINTPKALDIVQTRLLKYVNAWKDEERF